MKSIDITDIQRAVQEGFVVKADYDIRKCFDRFSNCTSSLYSQLHFNKFSEH